MHTITEPNTVSADREDARALQLRLYREIGLSAVAEALATTLPPSPLLPMSSQHSPATLVSEAKAA